MESRKAQPSQIILISYLIPAPSFLRKYTTTVDSNIHPLQSQRFTSVPETQWRNRDNLQDINVRFEKCFPPDPIAANRIFLKTKVPRRDKEKWQRVSREIATERGSERENFCTREAPPYTAATRASKYKGARRFDVPLCPSEHAFRRESLLFATRAVATISRRLTIRDNWNPSNITLHESYERFVAIPFDYLVRRVERFIILYGTLSFISFSIFPVMLSAR